ncbi:hypothetical protein MSG28_007779 [Choristoneura fumiferana]|uniref:Uncharacterized protein n=2 Tax=Choristoneura fumiferana TaxID=7141 RepID=A0ACC0JZA6_CHOFU|nr:hypothetical protein MSG28_007779 [Choristoneura fumiferana]
MAAGTALAIAFESIAETDGDESAFVEQLLPRLDELARDSNKFRAKKERKLQRATFRDILKYFEDDEVPSLRVRVGTESVECGTWWSRAAYGALAATLGAGLQALAPHCAALRAALGLADVPAPQLPGKKLNKLHRHLANNAADKARTVARGKNRDKRSAALAL